MLTFSAFDETEFGRSPALFRKKEYLDGSTSAQERRSGIYQLNIQSAAPCGLDLMESMQPSSPKTCTGSSKPLSRRGLKSFRKLTSGEVAKLLGVADSYLRQLSLDGKGPDVEIQPNGRRLYSLKDVANLRAYLDANARGENSI